MTIDFKEAHHKGKLLQQRYEELELQASIMGLCIHEIKPLPKGQPKKKDVLELAKKVFGAVDVITLAESQGTARVSGKKEVQMGLPI